jgi:hypothetical protein
MSKPTLEIKVVSLPTLRPGGGNKELNLFNLFLHAFHTFSDFKL